MTSSCIAQLNVAVLKAPLDAPATAGFVAALDPINAIADAAPGFVWRLQTDEGNATSIQVSDDPLFIVNLSVWRSLEDLRAFVYGGEHVAIMRRRRQWFERFGEQHMVAWPVDCDARPTPAEALVQLERFRSDGPGADLFDVRASS